MCTKCKREPIVIYQNRACKRNDTFNLCGTCKCYEVWCPNQKADVSRSFSYCKACYQRALLKRRKHNPKLARNKTTPWKCSGCGFQNPGFIKKCGNDVPYWQPAKGCGKRRTTERRRLNSARRDSPILLQLTEEIKQARERHQN